MTRKQQSFVLAFLLAACGLVASGQTRQTCVGPPPAALEPAPGTSIFTPQQEVDLGDIEAEQLERRIRVIHDDQLSAYLNGLVARIVAQLPPTHLQFRAALIDVPDINALSLPGGRIYVTRKMVAFVRNENELAGLLSHEMGHILSHQGAIDMTRRFRQLLGVTSVGDRKDISDKINLVLDNAARNPKLFEKEGHEEESHQYQADQVGLYALANAGYSPQVIPELFDRTTQLKGKTGSWLSDLFGGTTPNEKRLREMRKSVNDMPGACREQAAAPPSPEFLRWQSDVIAYSGLGRRDSLMGLLDKKTLDPPLRNDITHLKFSPDGKYVLAQDDASIFVLSREPFRLLFRIDATDAHPAQFTPDSQSVVFDTRSLRVEKWSIAEGERTDVHEVAVPDGCVQTKLSPDGNTLACVNDDFDILLYEVAQANLLFTKKRFFVPSGLDIFAFLWQRLASVEAGVDFEWVRLGFSPDARTFLGASPDASIAVNLSTHGQISLRGALTDMVKGGFAFLDADRVIAVNREDIKKSAIMKFPSGEVTERLVLGGHELSAAAHGDSVIVGPLKDYPMAVLNLSSNKFVFGSKDFDTLDAYDQFVLAQTRNGEIGLFNLASQKEESHAELSLSPLGRLRAHDVSPDLKWVALAGDTRGAVWNLATAKRLYHTRSFHGAYFDGDTAVFADFPKREPQDRSIGRMDLDGSGIKTGISVEEKSAVHQWGPYLVTRKPAGKAPTVFRNITLELHDVRDGRLLWWRTFPKERPEMTLYPRAGTLLLGWQVDEDAAKDEIKSAPALQARLAAIRDRKSAYLLQDLDAQTGKLLGTLIIDTGKGSFLIEDAYAVGDWVVVVDSDRRTLLYSLATGERKGSFFGIRSVLSPAAGLLSIENETGRLDIYSLPSLEKRNQLVFSSPIALEAFSEDGKRFFVLTANQTAYTFDTAALARGTPPATISADVK